MNTAKYSYAAAIGILLMLLVAGCSGLMSYGKLRPAYGPGEALTIQDLTRNWRDYNVYYAALHAGVSIDHPSAVMFDPKNDDRTVNFSRWAKVESEETLAKLIDSIQTQPPVGGYYARLWKLLGPDGQLYGYLFTPWDHVVAKVREPGTMLVYDIPLPPYLAQNGDKRKDAGPDN